MSGTVPPPPFTEAHEEFREEVRDWIAAELLPHVEEWEREEAFPDEVFAKVAAKGWLGITQPVEYGGLGRDYGYGAVFSEEMGRGCHSGGLAAGIGGHIGIAMPPISRFGTDEQRARWLIPGIRGEKIGALAITEPGGGSDVASARTKAEKVDGGWVVNGSKTYITNGVRADFYVTAVRTTPEGGHQGMSFLVIDKGPGVSTSKLRKLGWNASDTAEVFFEDVFVPEDHLLGELHRGFYLIMANFQGERLGMSLVALGEMRASFEATLEWLVGQESVTQYQRHAIARMGMTIEASAALTYDVLRMHLAGIEAVREVSMAKLFTQRANVNLQEECIRLRGIEGILRENRLERALRDARLGPIGGGTDEIMKEIIGRSYGL